MLWYLAFWLSLCFGSCLLFLVCHYTAFLFSTCAMTTLGWLPNAHQPKVTYPNIPLSLEYQGLPGSTLLCVQRYLWIIKLLLFYVRFILFQVFPEEDIQIKWVHLGSYWPYFSGICGHILPWQWSRLFFHASTPFWGWWEILKNEHPAVHFAICLVFK